MVKHNKPAQAAPKPAQAPVAPGTALVPAGPAPAQAPLPAAGQRGAVTARRWFGASLKANPQAVILTAAAAKQLPQSTVIVCGVNNNPKRNKHNVFVYPFTCPVTGKAGIQVGYTCTYGQFIAALAKTGGGNLTDAAKHLAWDATPSRAWVKVQQG